MAKKTSSTIELLGVNDVEKCKTVTAAWLRAGEPLAIDAEGLNLGPTRRLTLLQVATSDGAVTMFDVINPESFEDRQAGRRLLVDGGVKDVLQSNVLLKISHGCQWDCGALLRQFDITVKNAFDTQAAHLAIEYARGVRFPLMLKLEALAEQYAHMTMDGKDFKEDWLKDRLMFWGRRPLTAQALQYAAGDVRVLHQLHHAMTRKMSELEECEKHYEVFLDMEMNWKREEERITERSNTFLRHRMQAVFEGAEQTKETSSKVSDNEKGAIRAFRALLSKGVVRETDLPPYFQRLERTIVQEFEDELGAFQSGNNSNFDEIDWKTMSAMNNHTDSGLNQRINHVYTQLKKLRAKHETEKLRVRLQKNNSPSLDDLKASEFDTLNLYREFRSELEGDSCSSPTISRLELELSRRELTQWEALEVKDQLVYAVSPSTHGAIRALSRHSDYSIQTRARRLNTVVTILKTQLEIKALVTKYSNRPVHYASLSNNEKWTVKNYRQHKKSMREEDHERLILALEEELTRADLDQFERWQRAGQLSSKAGRVEKAVIKVLRGHDDAAVRRRAVALDEALRQQFRRGNVRGGRW